MMTRKKTRPVRIGDRWIGGDNPILIQSMTNTKTEDVASTVAQIRALEEAGCEIIRCAVPTPEAAEALREIKKEIRIPLVADIHFDYRLALMAMENGADKIRINPGNIGAYERIKAVADMAKEREIPIRVSLTGDPVEEIRSAKLILKTLGLRRGGIEIVSCPTCGRTQVDLIGLASQAEKLVENYPYEIKVAVMGCVVNGPGEGREADLGICGGKGFGLLMKKGEIIKKLPEDQLIPALKAELDRWGGA